MMAEQPSARGRALLLQPDPVGAKGDFWRVRRRSGGTGGVRSDQTGGGRSSRSRMHTGR